MRHWWSSRGPDLVTSQRKRRRQVQVKIWVPLILDFKRFTKFLRGRFEKACVLVEDIFVVFFTYHIATEGLGRIELFNSTEETLPFQRRRLKEDDWLICCGRSH